MAVLISVNLFTYLEITDRSFITLVRINGISTYQDVISATAICHFFKIKKVHFIDFLMLFHWPIL